MQPCEAALPSESTSEVPWKPTPSVIPIQRAFSGFSAVPPATVVPPSSPAQGELGTLHTRASESAPRERSGDRGVHASDRVRESEGRSPSE